MYCYGGWSDGDTQLSSSSSMSDTFSPPFWYANSSTNKYCFQRASFDSPVGKESACNARDPGSTPGLGRSSGEWIGYPLQYSLASLVAQLVMNLPAIWESWVQSLGWEDPLEKGKATHSSILAWRIPWTSPWGRKELEMTQRLSLSLFTVSRRRVEALTPTDLRTKMY